MRLFTSPWRLLWDDSWKSAWARYPFDMRKSVFFLEFECSSEFENITSLNAKQPTISYIRSLFIYFNRDYSFAYRKIAFMSVLGNYFDNKNRLVAWPRPFTRGSARCLSLYIHIHSRNSLMKFLSSQCYLHSLYLHGIDLYKCLTREDGPAGQYWEWF